MPRRDANALAVGQRGDEVVARPAIKDRFVQLPQEARCRHGMGRSHVVDAALQPAPIAETVRTTEPCLDGHETSAPREARSGHRTTRS